MKKIYFILTASLFATVLNAQSVFKLKKNNQISSPKRSTLVHNSSRIETPSQVSQIAATISCANQYTAGASNTFTLNISITNAGNEYGDSLALTFPPGFTLSSALPSDSLGVSEAPTTSASGCPNTQGGTKEPFNGINGQTVSWGNNDDCWGGLPSGSNTGSTFTVSVTANVAAGTTGPQTVNFHISGDGYGTGPGDLDGTFSINPAGANNATVLAGFLVSNQNSACGLTNDNLAVIIKNNGSFPIQVGTAGDSLAYTVNGLTTKVPVSGLVNGLPGPVVVVNLTGAPVPSIGVGDTAALVVTSPIDLSSAGTTYNISANISFVGSADVDHSDDTITAFSITHIAPINIDSTTYTEGFETGGLNLWKGEDVDSSGISFIAVSQGTAPGNNGSAEGIWFFENNTDGVFDNWAFSSCVDLTQGSIYYIKCYARLSSGYNGNLSYALSSNQTSAGVIQTIGSHSTLNANSTWTKDSISFVANSTGTFYLGLRALNTNDTLSLSMRVDDIKLGLLFPVALKDNNASHDAISIFPNPNNGVFTVKVADNTATVEVYSIIGENVYTSKVIKGNNTIDLSNLAAGSYIVKLNNGTKSVAKRVVINK